MPYKKEKLVGYTSSDSIQVWAVAGAHFQLYVVFLSKGPLSQYIIPTPRVHVNGDSLIVIIIQLNCWGIALYTYQQWATL